MSHNSTSTQNDTLKLADLDHFHGSEKFYRHPLYQKFVYTEGVQYVAEKGGAYWLIEKIFVCHMCIASLQNQPFTVWKLTLDGKGAKITVEDGNGSELYKESILFTDFPLPQISLWMVDNTLLLPSEY